MKRCQECGKLFESARSNSKYCSVECGGMARRKRQIRQCAWCGSDVEVVRSKAKKQDVFYCNQDCRTQHLKVTMKGQGNPNYKRVKYECDGCGKEIRVIPSKVKSQQYIFCDHACYKRNIGQYFVGDKNPNYVRIQVSCHRCGTLFERKPAEARADKLFCSKGCYTQYLSETAHKQKLKTAQCACCGEDITRHPSQFEDRQHVYCSVECKNKHNGELRSGANHPRWNPNLTKQERQDRRKFAEYREWREQVYKRDNYTCQHCGDDAGGNLNAHHIINYSENDSKRTKVDNGITLCDECHRLFHKTYGYESNTPEQLREFLSNTPSVISQ